MAQAPKHTSHKKRIIDRMNNVIVIAVGVSTFIVVFSLFSIRSLYSQLSYNNSVIAEKEVARDQINDNLVAVEELNETYTTFVNEPVNILGGNPTGGGPLDGNNEKIVLDALPSTYDFTGLSSSLEKILKDGGYNITGIGGREDADAAQASSSGESEEAVEIPYSFSVRANNDATRQLLETLERSIRPMNVRTLQIQADDSGLRTTVELTTYYAPEKTFETTDKVVR